MAIDHLGEVPLYLQVASVLRDRIRSGELEVGRPLPSLPQIMGEYEVSRGTARRAADLLAEEGLVRTVPGKGRYVIARP